MGFQGFSNVFEIGGYPLVPPKKMLGPHSILLLKITYISGTLALPVQWATQPLVLADK